MSHHQTFWLGTFYSVWSDSPDGFDTPTVPVFSSCCSAKSFPERWMACAGQADGSARQFLDGLPRAEGRVQVCQGAAAVRARAPAGSEGGPAHLYPCSLPPFAPTFPLRRASRSQSTVLIGTNWGVRPAQSACQWNGVINVPNRPERFSEWRLIDGKVFRDMAVSLGRLSTLYLIRTGPQGAPIARLIRQQVALLPLGGRCAGRARGRSGRMRGSTVLAAPGHPSLVVLLHAAGRLQVSHVHAQPACARSHPLQRAA